MRHDPTAMGYLTVSIAVPTFFSSRCYDRGDALTINVSSPPTPRASVYVLHKTLREGDLKVPWHSTLFPEQNRVELSHAGMLKR
jgi:hypothetical protein